jgi:hypothetical protein
MRRTERCVWFLEPVLDLRHRDLPDTRLAKELVGRVGACNLDEMLRARADGFAADATLFEWLRRRTAALMSA